ncbi:MAG: membrane protein insertase YidC [Deltaproteobacteria bacterium]|nr:membrane protein insertase YidC [Deltaproteobacteria bacterium]
MDTRTIIAFALMIFIYIYFFQPKPVQHIATNSIQISKEIPSSKSAGSAPAQAAQKSPEMNALAAKTVELKNEKVVLELSGLGSVKSAEFLDFKVSAKDHSPTIQSFGERGFNSEILKTSLGIPQWRLVSSSESELQYQATIGKLNVTRRIQLEPNSYILHFTDEITNSGAESVRSDLGITLHHTSNLKNAPSGFWKLFLPQTDLNEFVFLQDGSITRKPIEHLGSAFEKHELFSWAGFGHKYFFYGLIPGNISFTDIKLETNADLFSTGSLALSDKQIAPGETANYSYKYYLGPKEMPELKKASPDLQKVIDYGDWIGPIARFLLSILHLFYSIIPNYGVAIILLTILVKAVLYPLAYKSAVSMRKLQLVQPKMKEIREKYKNDKARMNSEMMSLYKTEKVNPIGGCLPLLLQMPVFFALYRVFFSSIELRQAPFFGWIQDLSVHDPLFVTPILMTALMWYQTKITPTPPAAEDNETVRVQKAMMKWMPIVFGLIMIFLPAGLTLYFLVNALLSVVQQVYLNKKLEKEFPISAKA